MDKQMVGRFIFKIVNIGYPRVLLKESYTLDNSVLLCLTDFLKSRIQSLHFDFFLAIY